MEIKHRHKIKTEERISQRVLYAIIAISAVFFLLFLVLGVQSPFAASPIITAPILVDVLIIFMWVLVGLTFFAMLFSIIRTAKKSSGKAHIVNGIPAYKIAVIVFCGTLLCLILTFALGSAQTMVINGNPFADKFWLKVSEMFVTSSLVMLLVAVGVTIFGATRYNRKERK